MNKIIILLLITIVASTGVYLYQQNNLIEKARIEKALNDKKISIQESYDKEILSLQNKKINKEEKRKEKLALTIQYIRDLGFEVDKENHTVSPLILMPDETIINSLGHGYMFKHLKLEELIRLNKYSKKPYLLRLENPIGLDFIIDYKKVENDRLDDDYPMILGELENIKLENGDKINVSSKISYYGNKFGVAIGLNKNKYMPDLTFKYHTLYESRDGKKLDGITILRIDLDPETGEKIYKRPIDDMPNLRR